MAGVTAHGASFSFRGFSAIVTGISVETPAAEVADMSGLSGPGYMVMVPTGDWSGGTVTVDFLQASGGTDPQTLVKSVGTLLFQSPGYSVERQTILESATTEARVGELVRGTLKFRVTDYYP